MATMHVFGARIEAAKPRTATAKPCCRDSLHIDSTLRSENLHSHWHIQGNDKNYAHPNILTDRASPDNLHCT